MYLIAKVIGGFEPPLPNPWVLVSYIIMLDSENVYETSLNSEYYDSAGGNEIGMLEVIITWKKNSLQSQQNIKD